MAFATSTHLVLQFDTRRIQELCSDTGTPVSAGSLSSNSVITWVLNRATEMILMAARQGDEYSEAELQTLADDDDAGWSIRGLTCDLAFGLLVMRRGTGAADLDRLSPSYGAALRTLQQISDGARIFPRISGDEHEDAGKPRTANLTEQTTSPTVAESWSATAASRLLPHSPLTGLNNWPYS
jgi:hypothetical protein